MQNPFTTAFSKTPENTYIHTDKTDEILENFHMAIHLSLFIRLPESEAQAKL